MRILMLTPAFPCPPTDGSSIRNFNIIKVLSDVHRVTLISFASGKLRREDEECLKGRLDGLETVDRPKGYGLLTVLKGILGGDPLPVLNYRSGEMAAKVSTALKDGYDAIHCSHLHMAQYAPDRRKCATVVDLHNVDSDFMRRYAKGARDPFKSGYARLTAGRLERYESARLPLFDRRISVSRRDQALFMSRGIRTDVIENGVDTDYFGFRGETPENLSIVFTGWMRYHPNDDAARYLSTEIMPLVRKKLPGAALSIVGKEPSDDLVRVGRGCGANVTGMVPDVRPYLYASSVYAAPLRAGGGTRLKILEAMAAGVPVVSTSVGCEGLDVEPGRHLLVADTAVDFASETARLLSDRALRIRLSREARGLVEERYSWDVIGKKMLDLYDSISPCTMQTVK